MSRHSWAKAESCDILWASCRRDMSQNSTTIYVYADWLGVREPVLMGRLNSQAVRGKELFSFEFDTRWLNLLTSQILDPDLQLYPGRQYADSARGHFGIFLDSSPDRWGRMLMRRREAVLARLERRPVRQLKESDYLLQVHDLTRMGALRFKLDESGEFVSHDLELPVPPWTSLQKLEAACRHYEADEDKDEDEKWIGMLVAPGSSLGGARPKANVLDGDGFLWIAKFPSRSDTADVGAWEMLAHELAGQAGLSVPQCLLEKLSRHGSTFMSRRFDRSEGGRIHFASAMTLLGRNDGDNYTTGCSYLDLAQFIIRHGARPNEDLEELWSRIVFNIAISNTDDHLRNHGFLLSSQGWTLSPAYDINPSPHAAGLSLNISEDDNSLDFDLAMSVAPHFRVTAAKANKYLDKIRNVMVCWRDKAVKLKIPRKEIQDMAPAFRA